MAVNRESSSNHLEEHIDQLEKLLKGQNSVNCDDYSKLDIDAVISYHKVAIYLVYIYIIYITIVVLYITPTKKLQ